jgi:hypothetical protein
MFFRLMEMECLVLVPDLEVAASLSRFRPDALILDVELESIATAVRERHPLLPLVLFEARDTRSFEDLLALFEIVLAALER